MKNQEQSENSLPNFEDYGEVLDHLLNQGQNSSNQLFQKVLDQKNSELEDKEKEIKRLEAEKAEWLAEKKQLEKEREQEQLKNKQLQAEINKQAKEINQLANEIKESNDDYYQLGLEKDQLLTSLKQEKFDKRELKEQLSQSREENYWLRINHRQTKNDLLTEIDRLTEQKMVESAEREGLQQLILEQEEKYEKEKAQREAKFNQQINNLRTFQLNADTPVKLRRSPKNIGSSSLPTSRTHSRQNSFREELQMPKPNNLFMELTKGNIFASSPLKDDTNPFETIYSPSPTPSQNSQYEQLMADLEELNQHNQAEEMNQQELELAWKTLTEEKIEHEKALQRFNERELEWERERSKKEQSLQELNQKEITLENEKQKLVEELAETKYKLAEITAGKERTEKSEKKVKYQLKTKEQKNEQFKDETLTSLQELNQKAKQMASRNQALIEIIKK